MSKSEMSNNPVTVKLSLAYRRRLDKFCKEKNMSETEAFIFLLKMGVKHLNFSSKVGV